MAKVAVFSEPSHYSSHPATTLGASTFELEHHGSPHSCSPAWAMGVDPDVPTVPHLLMTDRLDFRLWCGRTSSSRWRLLAHCRSGTPDVPSRDSGHPDAGLADLGDNAVVRLARVRA